MTVGRNTRDRALCDIAFRSQDLSRTPAIEITREGSRFCISDRRGDQVEDWQCAKVNGTRVGRAPVSIPHGATLTFGEWVKVTFEVIPEGSARLTLQGVCNPDHPENTSRVYLLLGDSISMGGRSGDGIPIESPAGQTVKLVRREDRTFIDMPLGEGDMAAAVRRGVRPHLEFNLGGQRFTVDPYAFIP